MDKKKNSDYQRVPPQASELEEYILGALMIESGAFEKVVNILTPECFYKKTHQMIFEAIKQLDRENQPTDMMMVCERLKNQGNLESVGGYYSVAMLASKIASSAHLEYHAQIVKQKYIAREIIRISTLMNEAAFSEEVDVDDILCESDTSITALMNSFYNDNQLKPISEILDGAEVEFRKRIELTQSGDSTGVTTGLFELNKVLGGGWQKSTLNIIAARPAMGKTAVMLAQAKAAASTGVPVCIYSLEMSSISLVNRIILAEAYQNEELQLKADRFRLGYCNDREWAMFEAAKERLAQLPIFIDDQPMVNSQYIRSHSKLMKKKGQCGIILIDYLQLTDMTDGNKTRNREQEVSQTTRQFKILSKELDIPIVLLSQLNRGVEGRSDKKPLLSDLRESGAIEQDADTVSFIYRPAYYKIKETDDGKSTENLGYFCVAKQRDGRIDDIPFTHNESMTKIWDYYEGGDSMPQASDDVPF